MVARSNIHRNVATWGTVLAGAFTIAGVLFATGDAHQQLTDHGVRLSKVETLQSDADRRLARIEQAVEDTRDTVHRLERGHIHGRVDDAED